MRFPRFLPGLLATLLLPLWLTACATSSLRGTGDLGVVIERANGQVSVKHLALITSWQKSRYFHYFGAGREGDQRFLSGDCAMLTSSSALNTAIRSAGMDVTTSI